MRKTMTVTALALMTGATALLAWSQSPTPRARASSPKRILLVTTTVGFRHASVPLLERVIRQMAKSTGEFTIVSTTDSADYPESEYFRTVAERNAAHPATPNNLPPINHNFFGPVATPAQYAALDGMNAAVAAPDRAVLDAARQLDDAVYAVAASPAAVEAAPDAALDAALHAEAHAVQQLAQARWRAVQQMQASPGKLDAAQLAALAATAGRGPDTTLGDFKSGGVTWVPVSPADSAAPPAAAPLSADQRAAVAQMNQSLAAAQQALATARKALARISHQQQGAGRRSGSKAQTGG